MTSEYRGSRDRLAAMVELLNTEDDAPVMMLYPMTVADYHSPDADPLLGVIADGDLVALAEHRCTDLAALHAEVEALQAEQYKIITTPGSTALQGQAAAAKSFAFQAVLDLIDKHREGQ